jgi:hypothetical protein
VFQRLVVIREWNSASHHRFKMEYLSLKIRDIGQKIGDIEIKKPSWKSISKALALVPILYRTGYWGALAWCPIIACIYIFEGDPVWSGAIMPVGIFALAVVGGDLLLMFIIKQYKN